MSSKLDDKVVLRVLREQRQKQLASLREEVDVTVKLDGDEKKVISPGLKLRSKDGGILYTVDAVSRDSVVLKDPSGQTIHINDKELASSYDLD
jgi:urease accessory protein UreE